MGRPVKPPAVGDIVRPRACAVGHYLPHIAGRAAAGSLGEVVWADTYDAVVRWDDGECTEWPLALLIEEGAWRARAEARRLAVAARVPGPIPLLEHERRRYGGLAPCVRGRGAVYT